MATPLQACLPNSFAYKNQGPPSRSVVGRSSNSFLRQGGSNPNARQNAANRRSAVERLEESKANYVKSERVLDSKQRFEHSTHLQVSNAPQLDLILRGPLRHLQNQEPQASLTKSQNMMQQQQHSTGFATPHDLGQKLGVLQRHSAPPPVLRPKSPGPMRARAKSQSEVRDSGSKKFTLFRHNSGKSIDEALDLESQLKRLISSGSKENILSVSQTRYNSTPPKTPNENNKVRRGLSDPMAAKDAHRGGPFQDFSIHKSMPDLSPGKWGLPRRRSQTPPTSSSESSDSSSRHRRRYKEERRPRSRTTSDYVSRSSSIRYDGLSNDDDAYEADGDDEQYSKAVATTPTLLSPPPPPPPITNRRKTEGQIFCTPRTTCEVDNASRRRRVLRSKSDVSHRYSKSQPELVPRRGNRSVTDVERFFDMMGLDYTVWRHLTTPSSPSSPPHFFDSISSVDSIDQQSSLSSDIEYSPPPTTKEGLTNRDLQEHGRTETSIIEKNARVIKWLYTCRKAIQGSGT